MALEQLEVKEIVANAVNKKMDIPEFQREFVWDPEQVKMLAESLCRGYPVGAFLLWNSSDYQEAKIAEGSEVSLWIVDGQQRTSALCLLFGKKPYWWDDAESWNKALQRYNVMVNVVPPDEEEQLEFALENPIRRRDSRWASVRDILAIEKVESLAAFAQQILDEAFEDKSEAMSNFGKVNGRIQSLWQIRNTNIPVVKIDHEVEDVAEIFARLNQEGTRVKEADVILALAAVKNPGWVRKEFLPFRNDLEDRGWDLDAGIYIRTMTGVGKGRARLIEVQKDYWDSANFVSVWGQSKKAISEVLKRLAEVGVTSHDLLPSANSLIPLFVLQHAWGKNPEYRFPNALHWFLLANKDGRYSGSAITSLNEDVRTIKEASSFPEAIAALLQRLQVTDSIEPDEFLNRYDRKGNRFQRLILYMMMFHRNATDWVDKTRIGYDKSGNALTAGFKPHWHHIFPRKVLKTAGLSDDEINAVSNITVMNERTNVGKLQDKKPWKYIQEFGITAEMLREHLVPEPFVVVVSDSAALEKQWDEDNYLDFVVERAQLLASEATDYLQELSRGIDVGHQ